MRRFRFQVLLLALSLLFTLAACKPVVLSGAQGHTGLFTPQLLDKAVDTNFCCRTDPLAAEDQLLEELLAALALPPERRGELKTFFDSHK